MQTLLVEQRRAEPVGPPVRAHLDGRDRRAHRRVDDRAHAGRDALPRRRRSSRRTSAGWCSRSRAVHQRVMQQMRRSSAASPASASTGSASPRSGRWPPASRTSSTTPPRPHAAPPRSWPRRSTSSARRSARFVEAGVEREEAEQLVALQQQAVARPRGGVRRSTRSTRPTPRTSCSTRLEALGVAEPWRLAEPLAAAGVDQAWLERVAELAGPATDAALRWVAATLTAAPARRRAAGVHRAHLGARRRGQELRLHGPRRAGRGRPPRRARDDARRARAQAQARGHRGRARLRPRACPG